MIRHLDVLALTLAGTAGAAGAGSDFVPPRGDWIQVDLAHFTIVSDASEKDARDIGVDLERFQAVLAAFHPGFRIDSRPTRVFLFRSEASFKPYGLYAGGKLTAHRGYFLPAESANYIAMMSGRGSASMGVYHEFVHEFLGQNLPAIPTWLGEGLADFYSTFQADDQGAQIGRPVENYVDFLNVKTLMPLPALFAVTPSSPEYNEANRSGLFYAESWALVHYLLQGSSGRRVQVASYLEQLRQGTPPERVFQSAFQATPGELMKELERYVAGRQFSYALLHYSDLKVDTSLRISPAEPETVQARLGELLKARDDAGWGQGGAAAKKVPDSRALGIGREIEMGRASELNGNFEGAAEHARKALAINPADPMACYFYAGLLSRHAQLEDKDAIPSPDGVPGRIRRAQELLATAVRSRPDFFEAYFLLGTTYLQISADPTKGIEAMKEALRLRPTSREAAIDLINLYLRHGDPEGASRVVDQMAPTLNDPVLLQQLRGQIEASKPTEKQLEADRLREIQESPEYAAQFQIFNDAVARANNRDYRGAIELLEKILPQIQDPDLLRRTKEMLARLRQDAGPTPRNSP